MAESGRDGGISAARELVSHRKRHWWVAVSVSSAPLMRTSSTRSWLVVAQLFSSGSGKPTPYHARTQRKSCPSSVTRITENLDDDWEPTDYGQAVSAVLAQFNAAR